ncbi:hypothetical protein GPL17_36590 [Bradyrhizobium yuanmingense]|uniref:hypothetical protein n=1 Tax=Bradyrhizobium yuanmingense TaxID=108015 RepID=UPI0012F91226|nr:hypothetical protein [Bradyrhizobium yuanmingense]MVT55903.1 hypothetical protein [Bradyrhizobium yuanmingense]
MPINEPLAAAAAKSGPYWTARNAATGPDVRQPDQPAADGISSTAPGQGGGEDEKGDRTSLRTTRLIRAAWLPWSCAGWPLQGQTDDDQDDASAEEQEYLTELIAAAAMPKQAQGIERSLRREPTPFSGCRTQPCDTDRQPEAAAAIAPATRWTSLCDSFQAYHGIIASNPKSVLQATTAAVSHSRVIDAPDVEGGRDGREQHPERAYHAGSSHRAGRLIASERNQTDAGERGQETKLLAAGDALIPVERSRTPRLRGQPIGLFDESLARTG